MGEGHHHGGDMGGLPGMSPPPVPHQHTHHHAHPSDAGHLADSPGAYDLAGRSDPMAPGYRRRRAGGRLPPARVGSARWVTRWIVLLVVVAFIVFVAFQVIHGFATTPSP